MARGRSEAAASSCGYHYKKIREHDKVQEKFSTEDVIRQIEGLCNNASDVCASWPSRKEGDAAPKEAYTETGTAKVLTRDLEPEPTKPQAAKLLQDSLNRSSVQ